MSQWLDNAIARAEALAQDGDWLAQARQASLALLKHTNWPTRKTEAWKYTSVFPLERADLENASVEGEVVVEAINGLDSIDLVFVDGQLDPALCSSDVPDGLDIASFSAAEDADQQAGLSVFAQVKPQRHLFGLVNDVLATDGIVINVAANTEIAKPIRIVHVNSAGAEAHTRVLVKLAENARATVVEQFTGNNLSVNTGFAEYDIAANAGLEHYRFALQTGEAISVGGSHFKLADNAELNSTLVGYGSQLSRVDVDVEHAGQHANAKLNAIYLLAQGEVFDLHSTIEHAMPNGTTEENVRGIVGDDAKAVFNGRIHIHRDAQKTLAELNNRNLLLSDRSEVNTKPELEIYADDVRCAHGATVAEVDKKALFYLRSRGVSKSAALIMLNFGFINELVDQMPNEALAEWLRPQLRERFAQMEVK